MSHRDQVFQAMWRYFAQSETTVDVLAQERRVEPRFLPDISFLMPVDDEAVIAQCRVWQAAFADRFQYLPQPLHYLHITLHYMGDLRRWYWQTGPTLWRRAVLPAIAEQIRAALENFPAFEVQIGPLTAFPSALVAEVHDPGAELDALRETLKAALPERAWPPSRFGGYVPHVTLGYWGEQPVAPLAAAIEPFRDDDPLPLRINRVKFTTYMRDPAALRPDVLVTAREEVIAGYQLRD